VGDWADLTFYVKNLICCNIQAAQLAKFSTVNAGFFTNVLNGRRNTYRLKEHTFSPPSAGFLTMILYISLELSFQQI